MKEQQQIQQGDVLFQRIRKLPENARPMILNARTRSVALIEGETTGHAHRLQDCQQVRLFHNEDCLFAHVAKSADVVHEEHQTVQLPPGIWQIDQVREFDYLTQTDRRVVD